MLISCHPLLLQVESSSTPCSHTVRYLATRYYCIAGGVEERGDRARGARHPAPAADGGGEGAQPEGGRQGALKTHSLTVLLLATAPNI